MKLTYFRHHKLGIPAHIIQASRITFDEITIVLKGELEYEINGKFIVLKEGDGLFLRQGDIRKRNITYNCDYVSFNFESHTYIDLPTSIPNCLSNEVKLALSICDGIFDKHYNYISGISSALSLIVKLFEEQVSTKEDHPITIKIRKFLKAHLNDKFTLKDISEQIGYSPNYCDTLFKKKTGYAIMDYVIRERIEQAKGLLAENVLSLKEISDTIGFDDYNYFSRAFKKKTGYSPLKYKTLLALRKI